MSNSTPEESELANLAPAYMSCVDTMANCSRATGFDREHFECLRARFWPQRAEKDSGIFTVRGLLCIYIGSEEHLDAIGALEGRRIKREYKNAIFWPHASGKALIADAEDRFVRFDIQKADVCTSEFFWIDQDADINAAVDHSRWSKFPVYLMGLDAKEFSVQVDSQFSFPPTENDGRVKVLERATSDSRSLFYEFPRHLVNGIVSHLPEEWLVCVSVDEIAKACAEVTQLAQR